MSSGDQFYLSVSSRSACWKRFLPSREGPSASAWETSALTLVKKFWGEAPRGAGQHRTENAVRNRGHVCANALMWAVRYGNNGGTIPRDAQQKGEGGDPEEIGKDGDTHIECDLDTAHFSGHERLGEVDLRIPELRQEREAELTRSVLLQNFLHDRHSRGTKSKSAGALQTMREQGTRRRKPHQARARPHPVPPGRCTLTSMVMKFLSDLLILRPSMCRWPVCRK